MDSKNTSLNTGDWFPFGFVYPSGARHSASDPDPAIENIRGRVEFLNSVYRSSNHPGHILAAALAKLQQNSKADVDRFWDYMRSAATPVEIANIADVIIRNNADIQDELPRLNFPNSVALFDCRFVSNAEWVNFRRYSIGGSEAAAVLGLSPWQTPATIYHEKTDLSIPAHEDPSREQLFFGGHESEEFNIRTACRLLMPGMKNGCIHWPEYRMFAKRNMPFITCNPDGILYFPSTKKFTLYEAKTAFWKKRETWKQGIPSYYVPQPRQYLEVLDDPRFNDGFIGGCLGGLVDPIKGITKKAPDYFLHRYVRDCAAGAAQCKRIAEYWNSYIATRTVPPDVGNAPLDLKSRYNYAHGPINWSEVVPMPSSASDLFRDWKAASADYSAYSKEIRKITEEMDSIKSFFAENFGIGSLILTEEYRQPIIITIEDRTRSEVNADALREIDPSAYGILSAIAEANEGFDCNVNCPTVSSRKKNFRPNRVSRKTVKNL